MEFAKLESKDVEQIAQLHIEGIRSGFISSLGHDFVKALYVAIAQSKKSFGFVAEENGKIFGFITFASDLNKLYRSIIFRRGLRFVFLLTGKVFRPRQMKKIFQTLFYPTRLRKMNLPLADLLSIVIAPEAREKGLGTQLIQKGFQECQRRGIEKVKVLVGADNEPANKLYAKCGFELFCQLDNHGILSNIYVATIVGA